MLASKLIQSVNQMSRAPYQQGNAYLVKKIGVLQEASESAMTFSNNCFCQVMSSFYMMIRRKIPWRMIVTWK